MFPHGYVNHYIEKHARDHKSQTQYILWGGANDIFLALSASDPSSAVITAAKKAADNMSYYAELLIYHGANNVIVINLPDLGQVPFAQKQASTQPGLPTLLSAASDTFNQELTAQLSAKVVIFDVKTLLNTIMTDKVVTIDGKVFSFSNVTDSNCAYDPDKGIASVSALNCTPPAREQVQTYLFEDGLHPTDAGHQVVAAKLAELIG